MYFETGYFEKMEYPIFVRYIFVFFPVYVKDIISAILRHECINSQPIFTLLLSSLFIYFTSAVSSKSESLL